MAIQFNTQKSIGAHTAAVFYMGNKKLLAILLTRKFMEQTLFRMPYICVGTLKYISNNLFNNEGSHQLRTKYISKLYD